MKKNNFKIFLFVAMCIALINVRSYAQPANETSAFSFNGNNAYVSISNSPIAKISGGFTLEFWINTASIPQPNKPLPIITNDSSLSVYLTPRSDDNFSFCAVGVDVYCKDNTTLTQVSKSIIGKAWYHVAIVFDGYNLSIYINGYLNNANPTTNTIAKFINPVNNSLLTGYSAKTKNYYQGVMKDVRIWGTALIQATIQNWKGQVVTSSHPNWANMIAYYRFDQSNIKNGSSVPDSKGSYNGTSINVVYWDGMIHSSFVPSTYTAYNIEGKVLVESGCLASRKTCATYFNNNIYQFFWDIGYGNMITMSLVYCVATVNDDNKVSIKTVKYLDGMESVNGSPGTCIAFNNILYLFSNSTTDGVISYLASDKYGNFSDKWKKINNENLYTRLQPASSVLGNNLFFFYIDGTGKIMSTHTSDGNKWSTPVAIKSGLNTSWGNVSACNAKDRNGNETIYLTYLSKTLDSINILRVYKEDSVLIDKSVPVANIRNVSIVQGTVKGSNGGYLIQVFYTATRNDIYGCSRSLGRIEYNINGSVSREEELPVCVGDGPNASSSDFDRMSPYAFSTYSPGTDSSLRKKVLISLINSSFSYDNDNLCYTNLLELKYLCWLSDKFKYIPKADTTDNNPDPRISTLLGVIEGPPPYVLNKEDLHSLISSGVNPSELEFGSSTSQSKDSSVTIGSDWSLKFRIVGLGRQFQGYYDSTVKAGYSWKKTQNRLFHPVEGKPLGYMVMLRPIITRKTYVLTDGNDNFNSYAYQFYISDRMLDIVPYSLDTARKAPNPADFVSYTNRDITFNDFEKVYQTNFSWTAGSPSEYAFEMERDSSTTINTYISGGYGVSVDISAGASGGVSVGVVTEVSVDAVIFELDFEYNWSTEHEESISISNTKNISINLDCPYRGVVGDTNYYVGTMYWLKYTDGKDNWWVPKGFEPYKPWCITYQILNFSTLTGIVSGADDNIIKEISLDNMYPNPARRVMNIKYDVNEDMYVSMVVYDILGNQVRTLVNDYRNKNHYNMSWDGTDDKGMLLPAGVYYCQLSGKNNSVTKKISLIE